MPLVVGQASNQGICAWGPNLDLRADMSFSRHRHEWWVGYTASHARRPRFSLPASHGPASHPLQMYPLVRELAADGVPVTVTCRVLKIARQPYYRWLASPVTDAELVEAYRANALFDAHGEDPEFGYRFLIDEAAEAGEAMCERTAWRICSTNGWWSAFGKPKKGRAGRPGPPVHDDLCAVIDKHGVTRHAFTAEEPNQLWVGDITEHWTREGKLYLCAFKDVYSNKIVGYSIDSRMKSRLAVAALNNAVARRGEVAGCVVHTDRGSQFRSRKFVHALNHHAMV